MTWGLAGLGGWWFWLRGDGEGDRSVNEVEGAALGGGGLGEFVDFDVGLVVADPVAGEGGQVIEQVAEASYRVASRVVFGGGFGVCSWGALRGGDGVVPMRRCFVGECQWRPGLAQVPDEVAGQHADQHVGFDAVLEAVVDGA